MMDVKVKKASKGNLYSVNFTGITEGMVLSLYNALLAHSQRSPVAEDLLNFLTAGVKKGTEIKVGE